MIDLQTREVRVQPSESNVEPPNKQAVDPQQRIHADWNRTDRDFPRKCIHELFEDQAALTPDAVALVFENRSLTYRELNSQANHHAHRLRQMGIGPGDLVGLCPERSLEMVVGLLAILKSGGAYVPLDPYYPDERLAYMIEDAGITVLLTQRHLADRLPLTAAVYLWLDVVALEHDLGNPVNPCSTDSLAYVIYTSGSTGKPKGVEIPHGALVNCIWHFKQSLNITPDDVWLAVTTLSFDIAGLEIWLPLLCGARCAIATRETAMDGNLLPQALLDHHATILQATPVTWRMLFLAGWKGNPDLTLLCGGEAMPQDLADQLAVSGAEAWNVYGPTETTIWSTTRKLVPHEPINIGRPMANTQLYVLDEKQNLLPVGQEGDLYIGGDGVARGYRNRPELTAEKFLPDPFRSSPGARIYNTGDRARWLPDGSVDLLGRADFQVKIRGYRIELGDIEAALRGRASVWDAIAAVREQTQAGKEIVAYLVLADNETPDVSTLIKELKTTLPDYMIPAHFYVIDALPLTANGKVDRKAIVDLDAVELTAAAGHTSDQDPPPKDLLEWELTKVWEHLFGKSPIGRHQNFFDLGGNSLLAARLTASIETLLQTKLNISSLFQSPTIAALAERLTKEEWLPPWSSLVPLQPLGNRPPLFLVHGWGGGVYSFVELAKRLAPDQPTYGIQAVGLDGDEPRHETVEEMAAHYAREICSFQPHGPYLLGGYSSGGLIAFEIARLLRRSGREIAALVMFDTNPIGQISYRSIPYVISRCLNRLVHRFKPQPRQQPHEIPEKARFGDYYHHITLAYRMRPCSGPITVLVSDESSPKDMDAWRYLVRRGLSFRRIPGGHWQIMDDQNVDVVAGVLRDILQNATRTDGCQQQTSPAVPFPAAPHRATNVTVEAPTLGGRDIPVPSLRP